MDRQTGNESDSISGKVLLTLKNGEVKILGSSADGSKGATIKPEKGVDVFCNGKQVAVSAEVFPGDKVEVKPQVEIKEDILEVKLSSDELRAEARYTPGVKKTYSIPDYPPTDHLIIEGIVREEKYRGLKAEDLIKAIEAERVVYGLDQSAAELLLAEEGQWHIVASGDPAQQGEDGRVEPLFESGVKSVTYNEEESKVDFRKRFEIVQVNEGGTIALIHPPIQGKPGKTVTGRELHPDPVKKAVVNCESGTKLSSDEKQVLGTRKGVPSYKKGRMHSFRVDDIYIHNGDVDIKSGNIDFRGHFKVQGAIQEGMKVSADGNIEISENASGAEVLAGGSIVFKANCIKCNVQAGWVDLVLKEVNSTLIQMEESVNKALQASEEVAKALEAKGKHSVQMEAAVIRSLLQSKFTELPVYAAALMKSLKEAGSSLPDQLVQTIKYVAPYFIDFQYSQSLARPLLYEIKDKLAALDNEEERTVEKANITASYIQNSVLTCTGDIIIPGQGTYNSRLKCGGEVNISRLFRGGSIEAGSDVYIGEAGTPRITADQGLIQVPYNGRVHIGVAYENIRVRFGTTEYRFEKNLNNIRVILDQQEFEVNILHWDK